MFGIAVYFHFSWFYKTQTEQCLHRFNTIYRDFLLRRRRSRRKSESERLLDSERHKKFFSVGRGTRRTEKEWLKNEREEAKEKEAQRKKKEGENEKTEKRSRCWCFCHGTSAREKGLSVWTRSAKGKKS
jgi:hypothetical protein